MSTDASMTPPEPSRSLPFAAFDAGAAPAPTHAVALGEAARPAEAPQPAEPEKVDGS